MRSPVLRLNSRPRHPAVIICKLSSFLDLQLSPEACQAFVEFLNETLAMYDKIQQGLELHQDDVAIKLLAGVPWSEIVASVLEVTVDELEDRVDEWSRIAERHYFGGLEFRVGSAIDV